MKGRLNAYAWDYLTDSNAWFLAPGKSKIQPTTMIVPQLTNDIASLSSIGYWFIPLVTKDQQEIDHARHSIMEDYSRAHKQLAEANTRIKDFHDRFGKNEQMTFAKG